MSKGGRSKDTRALNIDKVDSIRSFLEDSSMKMNSVHAPFVTVDISSLDEQESASSLEKVKKASGLFVKLGGEILVIHPSASKSITDDVRPVRLEKCERSLKERAEVCKKKKIEIAVENLVGTSLGSSSTKLLNLPKDLGPGVDGVCLDTSHINLKR